MKCLIDLPYGLIIPLFMSITPREKTFLRWIQITVEKQISKRRAGFRAREISHAIFIPLTTHSRECYLFAIIQNETGSATWVR